MQAQCVCERTDTLSNLSPSSPTGTLKDLHMNDALVCIKCMDIDDDGDIS